MRFYHNIKISFLFSTLFFIATNTAQAQQLGNNVIMIDDSIRTVWLTRVVMLPAHTYFDEKGRSDIHFSYSTEFILKNKKPSKSQSNPSDTDIIIIDINNSSKSRTDARFIPTDTNGLYRIEEMHFRSGAHVGHPLPPKGGFVGYSNDTTLFPVMVYNYYQRRAQSEALRYTVYKPKQLDEQPYFTFDDNKVDFKENILYRLKSYSDITENMSGQVKFSFEVNQYGWAINFKVDEMKLKPKNKFAKLNGDDIDFGQQINVLFSRINYLVVEYGFYMRDNRRFWTPGKIKGEAVSTKQYLTFNFK